jgi:hypothetical protein
MPRYYAPFHEIRHGFFKAMVWKRNSEHGVRYTATFARLHRSGESWLMTEALGRDDLLSFARTALEAHAWIGQQLGSATAEQDAGASLPESDSQPSTTHNHFTR